MNPVNTVRDKMKNEDITHKIIGAAYKVFNTLGFGYLNALKNDIGLLINFGPSGVEVK